MTKLILVTLLVSQTVVASQWKDIPKFYPGDIVIFKTYHRKVRIFSVQLIRACDPMSPAINHNSCDDYKYEVEFAKNTQPVEASEGELENVKSP